MFEEFLKKYYIETKDTEPLKAHLRYVWDYCKEANISERKALSLQINSIDETFFTKRKKHAIAKIAFDIYQVFSVIFAKQKEELMKTCAKLGQKLPNRENKFSHRANLSIIK